MATIWRMWMLAALLALGACTSGEPDTVISGDGTADEDIAAETPDPAEDPDLSTSFERLRGTSWQIIEIDGEATLPDGIGLALYMTDEGLKGSVTDRCGGTGEFFLDADFTVVRTQILAALCSPVWPQLFRTDASIRFELGDRLTISDDQHVMVARHFESVSQTGPVALGSRPDCGDQAIEVVTGREAGDTVTQYPEVNDLLAALHAGEIPPFAGDATEANLVDVRGIGGEQSIRAWYATPGDPITLIISLSETEAGGWTIDGWSRCAPPD